MPLKIVYNDRVFLPSKPFPKKIQVELGGNGWHLVRNSNFLLPKLIYLNIKHPNIHSRIDTSSIRNYLESHFSNVNVKQISLDQSEIPFDRKSHKSIFLKVDESSITIKNEYVRDSIIDIQPNRILVTGSIKVLSALPDTLFVIIPFKYLDKNFNEKIRLSYFLDNPNIKSSHEKVLVKFKVKQKSYAQSK